jgi:hypothetical protein
MAVGLLVTGVAACGDDEDDSSDETEATEPTEATDAPATTAADTTATTEGATATTEGDTGTTAPEAMPADVDIPGGSAPMEFCEGFVGLEMAMAQAPEDPSQMEAFATTQLAPNRELIEANAPDEVADEIATMLGALDELLATGDFAAFETPEFAAASNTVYPYLIEGCGLSPLDVEATDYAFSGVPEQLDAGLYVLQLDNASEGEFHEVVFAKLQEGVDMTPIELLSLPEEEAMQYVETFAGGTFAPPGESAATVVNLTEGEWMYVCFVPVGATPENEEGSGPPHFMEGMVGTVQVA